MKDYQKNFIDKCRISLQEQKRGNITNYSMLDKRKFRGEPLFIAKIETDKSETFWGFGNELKQGIYKYPASGSSAAFTNYVG